MFRRRGLTAALVAAAACLGVPAVAPAAFDQESLFMDDNLLMYRGTKVTEETFAELRALGVDRVRLSVHWRIFGRAQPPAHPADPGSYDRTDFDPLDFAIETAARNKIAVLLNVTGAAPDWAVKRKSVQGSRAGIYEPNADAFGQFTEMLGHRYSGTYKDESDGEVLPRVSAWSIWNEPNWGNLLQPQWKASRTKVRTRLGMRKIITGWTPRSPHLYRALYRAATGGLQRSGHGSDTILLGETAPLGSRWRGFDQSLRPLQFLRELFCLDRELRPLRDAAYQRRGCDYREKGPLHATGFAHHPYSVQSSPATPFLDPDTLVLADRQRLYALLDRANVIGRIPPGLPMWITEYGYQTAPPDPFRGVTLEQHARWLSEAELITWSDARIATHAQFLLRDDVPREQYPAGSRGYWSTYQSGLQFASGERKPAYDAYRLPFFAPSHVPAGQPLRTWGMVRGGANGTQQAVELQWRPEPATAWQTVTAFMVEDARGYFTYNVDGPRAGEYRYVWEEPRGAVARTTGMPPPTRHASAPVRVGVG